MVASFDTKKFETHTLQLAADPKTFDGPRVVVLAVHEVQVAETELVAAVRTQEPTAHILQEPAEPTVKESETPAVPPVTHLVHAAAVLPEAAVASHAFIRHKLQLPALPTTSDDTPAVVLSTHAVHTADTPEDATVATQ